MRQFLILKMKQEFLFLNCFFETIFKLNQLNFDQDEIKIFFECTFPGSNFSMSLYLKPAHSTFQNIRKKKIERFQDFPDYLIYPQHLLLMLISLHRTKTPSKRRRNL